MLYIILCVTGLNDLQRLHMMKSFAQSIGPLYAKDGILLSPYLLQLNVV